MKDWSTPFDPSMLDSDLLIRVPSPELANELAAILDCMGIMWGNGIRIHGHTEWHENVAWKYYPDEGKIRRGTVSSMDAYRDYDSIRRCTFYGYILDDVDVPDGISLF